jgi:hypothetical protein
VDEKIQVRARRAVPLLGLISLREYWNMQKKGLMQKLLTGKIRVKI